MHQKMGVLTVADSQRNWYFVDMRKELKHFLFYLVEPDKLNISYTYSHEIAHNKLFKEKETVILRFSITNCIRI